MDASAAQSLESLYKEVFTETRYAIGQKLEADRLFSMTRSVMRAFRERLYNALLIYFYTTSKDHYIVSHIVNNMILAVGFGVYLRLSEEDLRDLTLCAFGHDFGMVEYTHFFQKGHQLTPEENRLIRRHPLESARRFEGIFPDRVLKAIEEVHEAVDGTGYPMGKTGLEISSLAKITAICDVFEALTHPRSFRREFTAYEAIKLIIKKKDRIFDKWVLKRFVEFLSIYPVGGFVMLNTGETGMVVAAHRAFPTKPVVRVLLNARHEVESSQREVDLVREAMIYVTAPLDARAERELLRILRPRGSFDL